MEQTAKWYKTGVSLAARSWHRVTNLEFDLKLMMTAHAAVEIPVGLLFLIGRPAMLFNPMTLTASEADALSNPAMVLLMRWFGVAILCGGLTALLLRNAIPKKSHDVVIYGIALYHALLTALSLGHRYDFADFFVPFLMPACHGMLALGFASVAALGNGTQRHSNSLGSSSDRTTFRSTAKLQDSQRYDPFSAPDPYAQTAIDMGNASSVAAVSNAAYAVGAALGRDLERAVDDLDPFVGDSSSEADTESTTTSGGRQRVLYPIDGTPDREEFPVGRLASCLSESNSMMLDSADGSSREALPSTGRKGKSS